MDMLHICAKIETFFALPTTALFLIVGTFLTLRTRFAQIRLFPRFIHLLAQRGSSTDYHSEKKEKTISPFRALLTAMGTTI